MFIPRPDATLGTDEWLPFVRAMGFGHLVAPGAGRDLPVVVPTQYVMPDAATVLLHLAAPNPVFAALAERPRALLSVAGDWAYVPAGWKAIGDEDPALGVPTTYYAAVQLSADVTVVDDDDEKLAILRAQLAVTEPSSGVADPDVHRTKLRGIRGLRLRITDVRAKLKYGNNVDADHAAAVADRLDDRAADDDAEAAAHTRRRLAARQ